MAGDESKSKLFGEGLPGTGGDFVDPKDVEGHRSDPTQDGPPGVRIFGENQPGRTDVKFIDEDDVEGHLYRSGPTTQGGEFAKRLPTDNPHGEH